MATKKVNTYIGQELEWLEGKANELKQYVDDRPFHKLVDRIHFKETKTGGMMPLISATIEAQLASITKALKEYADIIRVVNEMRENEDKKQQMRKGFEQDDILDEEDDN
jgi:hypothetical protein